MKITKEMFEKQELLGKSAIIHSKLERLSYEKYDRIQDTYLVDIRRNGVEHDYNKVFYPCDGRNVCIEYRDEPAYKLGVDPWFEIIASDECWVSERDFDNDDCWIEILPREEVLARLNERIQKFFNPETKKDNETEASV